MLKHWAIPILAMRTTGQASSHFCRLLCHRLTKPYHPNPNSQPTRWARVSEPNASFCKRSRPPTHKQHVSAEAWLNMSSPYSRSIVRGRAGRVRPLSSVANRLSEATLATTFQAKKPTPMSLHGSLDSPGETKLSVGRKPEPTNCEILSEPPSSTPRI